MKFTFSYKTLSFPYRHVIYIQRNPVDKFQDMHISNIINIRNVGQRTRGSCGHQQAWTTPDVTIYISVFSGDIPN